MAVVDDLWALVRRAFIRYFKRRSSLLWSDTTLRDGEQMPHVNLQPAQKLAIARRLPGLGINIIDAGFPACCPSEIEAIQMICREVRGPIISALCRARSDDIELAAEALRDAHAHKRSVTIFIGTSPIHRKHKLGRDKDEVLAMVTDAIRCAREHFDLICFSAEDASRTEPAFLYETYSQAIDAGATALGFADTVGILTPEKAARMIRGVKANVSNLDRALLGVHFHNDLGLATANALACIQEGIDVVQCTINGLGERAGNTDLGELAMALKLHQDQYGVKVTLDTTRLFELSRLVARLTGVPVPVNKSVVGPNVFATEAGVHQDGLLKHEQTYLPFPPTAVGHPGVELVVGKHSGRHVLALKLHDHGIELNEDELLRTFHRFKELCDVKRHVTEDDLVNIARAVLAGTQRAGR